MSKITNLEDVADNLQRKLIADLSQGNFIHHSGTKGDSTEEVWRNLFSKYLPLRFRVASAIIVDSDGGTSDQIDCVIYDAHFTPQIMPEKASLYIPAEAVHAIFEVKPKVTKEELAYAARKIKSVRDLKRTSTDYTGDGQKRPAKPLFPILGGLLTKSVSWQDGFESRSFLPALEQAQKIAHIDFIFAADVGYADMVKTQFTSKYRDTNKDGKPIPVVGAAGIMHGLFRLLEELTRQGTVPAIDWSEYYSKL